jgi:hypothetical protein
MKRWEELGNNRFKLSILSDDPEDQTPPSVYRGTKDEIAEMLAESQGHANRRISELRRNGNGQVPQARPKPLTAEEQFQTVTELDNPATVVGAITRVVESQMGETMAERRTRQQREDYERGERAAVAAATSFAQETPEWYPTEHNKQTLVEYMQARNMDPSDRDAYTTAFEKLSAAKLLQPKPIEGQPDDELEEEDGRERNAPAPVPVPRPSRVSTGVMQRDISGLPPRPTTRVKYTREQIADLSAADYKRLMLSDNELSRCVEFYAQQDRQRRRTG